MECKEKSKLDMEYVSGYNKYMLQFGFFIGQQDSSYYAVNGLEVTSNAIKYSRTRSLDMKVQIRSLPDVVIQFRE